MKEEIWTQFYYMQLNIKQKIIDICNNISKEVKIYKTLVEELSYVLQLKEYPLEMLCDCIF